jgi:hypothetical protein
MGAVFQGDTLTIQMQGSPSDSSITGYWTTLDLDASDLLASDIAEVLNGEGFACAIDSNSTNLDGSLFVQIDLTASQDYGDSSDVLSIAVNAWVQSTGQYPSSSVITDINGVSVAGGLGSSGSTTLAGAIANPGAVASKAGVVISSAASSVASGVIAPVAGQVDSLFSGIKSVSTTALILVAVIIIVAILVLTTSGGQGAARLFL